MYYAHFKNNKLEIIKKGMDTMDKIYDLIIIGAGPAGLSAAVYASRARLDAIILEENHLGGGQIVNTYDVENYLGFSSISGFDLAAKFRDHAEHLGAKFVSGTVTSLDEKSGCRQVICNNEEYLAKSVIIASGARHKKLEVPGEENLGGRGVSYCATCDGALYKGKTVAVVGGGDTAAEDAIYLANLCETVYLIHRRDTLRASHVLQEKLRSLPNVKIFWNSQVQKIEGQELVESVWVKHAEEETTDKYEVQGVFIAIGITPNSANFSGGVQVDESGFIIADEFCETSRAGVFAAGDVRTKQLRQIATAVSDGANAANSAEKYIGGFL